MIFPSQGGICIHSLEGEVPICHTKRLSLAELRWARASWSLFSFLAISRRFDWEGTPPKFNIAPENRESQKKTHLPFGGVPNWSCPKQIRRNSLPETNIVPEKWWLEDYFPIGFWQLFRDYVKLPGGIGGKKTPLKNERIRPPKKRDSHFSRDIHLNQPLIFRGNSLVFRGVRHSVP